MKRLWYALIALAGLGLDQLVKWWARTDLQHRPGGEMPLIDGVFYFTYVENRGAAFGLMQNQRWLFLILMPIVAIAIVYYLFFYKKGLETILAIPLSVLLAGTLGNLTDRLFLGYVVDMFDFRLINFAVFNVADICVVCSVIFIAAWVMWTERKNSKTKSIGDKPSDETDS